MTVSKSKLSTLRWLQYSQGETQTGSARCKTVSMATMDGKKVSEATSSSQADFRDRTIRDASATNGWGSRRLAHPLVAEPAGMW